MNKIIIVGTTKDRQDDLAVMIKSALTYLKSWYIVIVTQGYSEAERKSAVNHANIAYLHFDDNLGPHGAKIKAIEFSQRLFEGEEIIFCSADDDMEFLPTTDFSNIIAKISSDPSTGFVTSNWANSSAMLKHRPIKDEFIKQNIVYTAGGMLFSNTIASLILELPDKPYWCDNTVWSTHAYINGFTNYRYRGSVAIHRVCQTGGRKGFVGKRDCDMYDESLVLFKKGKTDYLIATDKDLTEKAHQLHESNKQKLYENL